MTTNKPELNSIWTRKADNQQYKVVGYKNMPSGRLGIEVVRFIKSRDSWAKTPVVFTYVKGDETVCDFFYNAFTK